MDADTLWYTDGSAMEKDGPQVIGASVCCQCRHVAARVECGGVGSIATISVGNTIDHAEMCGIKYCLQ